MKRTQIHLVLPLFLVGLLFNVNQPILSQQIKYIYDAAGNRTGRQYIVLMQKSKAQTDTMPTESVIAPIGDYTISVFPNPVQEMLTLSINGSAIGGDALLQLYDAQGRLLQQSQSSLTQVHLNLLNYASGWYILKVRIDGHTTDFKIIKD